MKEQKNKSRDTSTGHVLEAMVVPALKRGGYQITAQKLISPRLGGKPHKIDLLAEKDGRRFLISLKWQQTSGTAEQKVPYEFICLIKAIKESAGAYSKGYIVLGGNGWTLRDSYVSGELKLYIKDSENVHIVTLESFIAKANEGKL